MFEFDWIVISVYGIVVGFALWAILKVWTEWGIFSVVAPLLSVLGYGIASVCDHFEWSINYVFWGATIIWTILWVLAFIGALTDGKFISEEMAEQWKKTREQARRQTEYSNAHWQHFHNPNSTYNKYQK